MNRNHLTNSTTKRRRAVKRRPQVARDGQAGELGAMSAEMKEAGCEVTADYWLGYVGIDEAARFLGTTNGELYNLTSSGEIPFVRWGKSRLRFQRLALRRWMEGRGVRAST